MKANKLEEVDAELAGFGPSEAAIEQRLARLRAQPSDHDTLVAELTGLQAGLRSGLVAPAKMPDIRSTPTATWSSRPPSGNGARREHGAQEENGAQRERLVAMLEQDLDPTEFEVIDELELVEDGVDRSMWNDR